MKIWSAQTGAGASIMGIAETLREKDRIPDKMGVIVTDGFDGLDYSEPISKEDRELMNLEKIQRKQKSRFKSAFKLPYKPTTRRK